jgi:spermidine synthase
MAILILFFCSGATALVYEVIWSKYLALLFGSTIQAQTVVLAVFMGGLALGNKLFSRHADSARNPLAIYGRIEIAIGGYALLFWFLYRAADWAFARIGSGGLDHPFALLLLKGFLSIALLLGPTILMGGTLPILAAWLQRNAPDGGRQSARFYSVNSLGAVCGAGFTGFFLVQWLGLRTTMDLAAVVNIIIGLTAIVIGKKQSAAAPTSVESVAKPKPATGEAKSNLAVLRWGCIMVALTGAVSMGLEVLSSRCLCLIFGASLQVFAIVLMAFILGIGLGSAVVASPRFKHLRGENATIYLLLGAATLIGLVVFNIENLVSIYLEARSGLSRTPIGYHYHQILMSFLSICVLGLPAAALGSVLPLWIRAVSETSPLLGDRVGRLLTWNTLGAVGGSLATGFILMPSIGLRASFTTLGAVLVVAAILAAIFLARPGAAVAGVAAAIFLVMAWKHGDEGWRYTFSAGVFRSSDTNFTLAHLQERRKYIHLDFYEDAPDATVSVERELYDRQDVFLRIDGKVDASGKFDKATQLLTAHLPLIAKPDSKDVFCFGMGSGVSAGATLGYPIEHLTVAENCEPVLRAASLFNKWNQGVLTNSRAHIYHEDARTVLKLSPQKYDVILSEPSNPWMVGVASVYTREFFELAASRLKPGGLMTQWFHTYEMDDADVDLVLRSFGTVFPQMEVWDVAEGDIVILGSDRPWDSSPRGFRSAIQFDAPRRDLASIGLETPVALLARRMASQRTAFAIADPGPIQRDDFPILEYAAPRAFYLNLQRRGVFRLDNFDERTWQKDLAIPEANQALGQLDPASLKTIFGSGTGTVNDDLGLYLKEHYMESIGKGETKPLMIGNRPMPCSMQGANRSVGIPSPPSAATNDLVHQLVTAEYAIRTGQQQALAIASIENALDATPYYDRKEADWSPAYYADLGVKASLSLGNLPQAKAILLRGLQLEPNSDQLAYLSRILDRQMGTKN